MDPDNQDPNNPAPQNPAPADPAAPAQPADNNQDPQPPANPDGTPPAGDDDGGQPPAGDDDGQDPQGQQPGSRQERRNQERAQRMQELNQRVRQSGQPSYQPGQGQNQSPQFPNYADGQVVSPQQLQQDVVQTADAIASIRVNQQMAQQRAVDHFERDQEIVPSKYPELNPENAAFTPELDEAIAQEYQERAFEVVGYDNQGKPITRLNPSVRLADIAARHVKAARAYAAKTSADTQNRENANADATAPRPNGGRPAAKKFEDLTLDEMRAKVGYHRV